QSQSSEEAAMKYFTPARYLAQQDFDPAAMDAADADWEAAVEQYEIYLRTIQPDLPAPVQQLVDGFYLHDARVLSIGQRDGALVITLQLDVPAKDLLTITYTLAGQPVIDKQAFCPPGGPHTPLWLFEEIEAVCDGDRRSFAHNILLSNGWALRVPFSDVRIQEDRPVFPLSGSRAGVPGISGSVETA